jgi:hypothetical protein
LQGVEDGFSLSLVVNSTWRRSIRLVRSGQPDSLDVWTVNEVGGKEKYKLKVRIFLDLE